MNQLQLVLATYCPDADFIACEQARVQVQEKFSQEPPVQAGTTFERPILLKPARSGGSVATIFPELAQVKLFAGYWLQYHIYYYYYYYYYYYHPKIIITIIIIIIIFFQNINKSVIIIMGLHYFVHQSLFFGLFSFFRFKRRTLHVPNLIPI